jgi:hypothetical protein
MSESLTIKAGVDGANVMEGLKKIEDRLSQFGQRLSASFAAIGVTLAFGEAMKKAFDEGGKQEELIEGMAVLAGGTKAAKDRLAEMSGLIQKSPFGKQEFVEAYKSLQLYTNGLYSNNAALKLAGDVAAATETPLSTVAAKIGLAYESIMAGDGGGRALKQLTRLGVISTDTADKIGRMGGGKANAGAVWEVLQTELSKFDGAMEAKSHSWSALMKNFKISVDAIYSQFALPIMDALKPMLEEASVIASRVATYAKAAGEAIAKVIKVVVQAFREGQVISLISDGLVLGFKVAINYLYASFQGVARAMGSYMGSFGDILVARFSVLMDLTFWKGIGEVAIGGLAVIGGYLMSLMSDVVAYLAAGLATAFAKAINGLIDLLPNSVAKTLGLSNIKGDENFDSNLAKSKAFFAPVKDAADSSTAAGAALAGQGVKDVNSSTKAYRAVELKALADAASEFTKGLTDGLANAPFGDVAAATTKFSGRITKLLSDFDKSAPKEKKIPNPFHEGFSLPQQMTKGVADSFAQIGAGGRVSSYSHFDPMVQQQRRSNELLETIAGNTEDDGSDDAPVPEWSAVN